MVISSHARKNNDGWQVVCLLRLFAFFADFTTYVRLGLLLLSTAVALCCCTNNKLLLLLLGTTTAVLLPADKIYFELPTCRANKCQHAEQIDANILYICQHCSCKGGRRPISLLRRIEDTHTSRNARDRSITHSLQRKMSFDEIFDLTAGWSVFLFL